MGRRRKKAGLAEILIVAPWWISVSLGVAGYIALRWIIPAMLPPLLESAASSFQTLAWLPLAIFGFLGFVSFARSALPALGARRGQVDEPVGTVKLEPRIFASWTLDALHELEWKRFELLCAKYYDAVGFKTETIRCGADGGIDIKLFMIDPTQPIAVVQCKAWNSASVVGVKEVRELLGVMAHEKVERGVFITTSSYTKDALSFGEANRIQLIDGPAFIRKIQQLPKDAQDELLKFAFEGDYKTPTCASCGIKMVKREGNRGAFWGCLNYPKCRSTFATRTAG